MISKELQTYLRDEIDALGTDTDNQLDHIKKIHGTCELLLAVSHEQTIDKSDLIKAREEKNMES